MSMQRSVTRRRAVLALTGLVAPLSLVWAGSAEAAEPAMSSLTVPVRGGVTVNSLYTGTAPGGAELGGECPGLASPADEHVLDLEVIEGTYDAVEATINFSIDPADGDATDLIITVRDEAGVVVGSNDSGGDGAEETVTATDLPDGLYTVSTCGFAAGPTDYDGEIAITTVDRNSDPGDPDDPGAPTDNDLPIAPTDLQFSATVPVEPQRDGGEPAITMSPDGLIYSCGISGFSQVADYALVSDDDGDQFHLLGTAPRGQISAGEGGGDCALATSPVPNEDGDHTLAYAGLGPLTNFSTFTSDDSGQTLQGSPISESVPGVDRQWITFTDADTAFLTFNAFPGGEKVVQKSTNGGLTYGLQQTAAEESGRIGQIRSFLPPGSTDVDDSYVYFPYSSGTEVKIALSKNNGDSYSQCLAVDAGVDPGAGFVTADHDDAGNVYVTYSEKGGGRDTYVVAIPFADFVNCEAEGEDNSVNPGFSPKVLVNRGAVETSLFPWVAAQGLPGRVAVATYGTTAVGNPDDGEFDAAWDVYVNQILDFINADGTLNPNPTVSQVKATTHPFHYDSICTNGLGCTVDGADRSLIDYFTIDYNSGSGLLSLVYSQANKKPDDPAGFVATGAIVTQVAGPSNGGAVIDGGFRKQVLRTTSPDPAEDALVNYSFLVPPGGVAPADRVNVPALDLVDGEDGSPSVTVGPERDLESDEVAGDGFTVTMRYDDLSDAALASALTAGTPPSLSLTYLFKFTDGYQSGAAAAFWDPDNGFQFGYNDYVTGGAPNCGPATDDEKCLLYPGNEEIQGEVDQEAGTITLTVPADKLEALGTPDAAGRPSQVSPAPVGSRMYDATAISLASPTLPDAATQTFMTPVDNAPAFDFVTGAGGGGGTDPNPQPVIPEVPVAVLLPLAAAAAGAAVFGFRRRRASTV